MRDKVSRGLDCGGSELEALTSRKSGRGRGEEYKIGRAGCLREVSEGEYRKQDARDCRKQRGEGSN